MELTEEQRQIIVAKMSASKISEGLDPSLAFYNQSPDVQRSILKNLSSRKDLAMKKEFKLNKLESGAHKHLEGKLRLDLVPPEVREIFALVSAYGISKGYGEKDWEKGIPETTLLAAMERHELHHLKGTEFDEESGLPHIYHMMWNAVASAVLYTRSVKPGTLRKKNQ